MGTLLKILLFPVFATLAAAQDPSLLNLVPADAKIVAGVRVDSAKASTFGMYVLAKMQANGDQNFQQFVKTTGFDPTRDLYEIVTAATGTSADHSGLILGRGSFNIATITAAAQSGGAATSMYNGTQLLTHPEKSGGTGAVAFLNGNVAAMGPLASVQAAIDRQMALNSKQNVATLPADVLSKIATLSAANDAWFLSTGPVSGFFAGKVADPNLGGALQGNLLQAVQQASGGVKFNTDTVMVSGEALARSQKDAEALRDVVKFLAGMVQLNKDSDPKAQKLATLLDTLQVSAQNSTMTLSMTIPEQTMEQLFVPAASKPRTHRAARTAVQ